MSSLGCAIQKDKKIGKNYRQRPSDDETPGLWNPHVDSLSFLNLKKNKKQKTEGHQVQLPGT